ncbi:MAG: hypothetical protein AABY27_00620 [Pseudomonadota bacterium]
MVINEARKWLGTRYKHQGRVRKGSDNAGGCDCLGLILGLGIKTKANENLNIYDIKNYPKYLTSNFLLDELDKHLIRVDELEPGNIILIRINNWPQHLALVTGINPNITIIHSYAQARKVVEQHLPKIWEENIVAIYSSF